MKIPRKTILHFLHIALVASVTFPVLSQARTWAEEPETFFGVKVGGEFPGQIPRCDFPNSVLKEVTEKTCQFETLPKGKYGLRIPDVGVDILYVDVDLVDGKAAKFTVMSKEYNFTKVMNLLRTRYGEPTISKKGKFTTNAGDTYSSMTHAWVGKKVNILGVERYQNSQTCGIVVYARDLIQGIENEEANKLVRNASKL